MEQQKSSPLKQREVKFNTLQGIRVVVSSYLEFLRLELDACLFACWNRSLEKVRDDCRTKKTNLAKL